MALDIPWEDTRVYLGNSGDMDLFGGSWPETDFCM